MFLVIAGSPYCPLTVYHYGGLDGRGLIKLGLMGVGAGISVDA